MCNIRNYLTRMTSLIDNNPFIALTCAIHEIYLTRMTSFIDTFIALTCAIYEDIKYFY